MLFKSFSFSVFLAVSAVAATPVVENRALNDLEARGGEIAPDHISTRSKWSKRDDIVAREAEPQIAPDRISTRSKWSKRAEIAARSAEPEPEAVAAETGLVVGDPEAVEDTDNIIDCCISTRSQWSSAEVSE
ncbi:hypothetical protein B0H66DRAFT_604192 [Apodospora peruviana]|uniref:Uncharacterized protein n=1 Tax=Apodospora peruviana TaxID=516989 RepID=A0AAE0I078_9PEZI|nr:hypothetical protein B0H66DRAFT_604192 [Apodospora peruviana]